MAHDDDAAADDDDNDDDNDVADADDAELTMEVSATKMGAGGWMAGHLCAVHR